MSVHWIDYQPWREAFAEAMDPRLYTLEWLDMQVLSGEALCFTSENAAILAKVATYPTGTRAIEYMYVAGDLDEIVNILRQEVEDYGKSVGCDTAFGSSREAWARILKNHGYDAYKVTVRKDL